MTAKGKGSMSFNPSLFGAWAREGEKERERGTSRIQNKKKTPANVLVRGCSR